MYDRDAKKSEKKMDKSPYDRRGEKITGSAFKSVGKSVEPVAKDTNKTRRKDTRARIVGTTEKKATPKSSLKKDMKRPISTK